MTRLDSKFWTWATLLSLLCVAAGEAADHLDAPGIQTRPDVDINDLYAFQSPTNPDNTVLIMTVNPFATPGATFNTDANYAFHIDNNGDAMADIVYDATFTAGGMLNVQSSGMSVGSGAVGETIALAGGGLAQAGIYDDPFFFDLDGFTNGLMFTGEDAFAGADVSGIVLEIPSASLGGSSLGVWATTSDASGQIDRMGRPAINTVLIPLARKDEFNQASPADDFATFGDDVQTAIESLNGGDAGHAATLTSILLPDVLTIDTSDASGFLNGRQLADDVIDAELTLLTNSMSPIGDGVDANDVAFPGVFPYLAPANVPEPSGWLLGLLSLPIVLSRRMRRRSS